MPLNGKPVIELTKGGTVEVSAGNTRNQDLVSQIKSPAGVAPIGHKGENGKLSISGNDVSDLAGTIASATSGTIINFPGNSATLDSAPTKFKEGVILNVNGGQILTINKEAAGLLNTSGTIKINAGGTVKLPDKESKSEAFVGTTDARMNLGKGSIALDLGQKTLTIAENAQVEIPNGKTCFTRLGTDSSAKVLKTTVENGAQVTVASGGTWKVTKGAELNIKGTVDASAGGLLTLSLTGDIKIDVTGKLALPLMSKKQLQGETDTNGEIKASTGLRGNITIHSGAELSYNKWNAQHQ